MMYAYMTLADGTEIVHSHLIEDGVSGERKVLVHFERPNEHGFDSARCCLSSYEWIFRDGFTDSEIAFFEKLLQCNAHLFYEYAATGGICLAPVR